MERERGHGESLDKSWHCKGPGWGDVLRWKLRLGPREPASSAPDLPAEVLPWVREEAPSSGWRVTWLGHASFLLEGCGLRLVVDPMLSAHCAPVPMKGMKRLAPPACGAGELGRVDAVLLTHTHYDHLDLPTLRALGTGLPLVVAHGHEGWLKRKGFSQVTELEWFGQAEVLPGVRITATPARHVTARTPFDRGRGRCCGFRVEGGGVSLWHGGDSGYTPGFREIGERLGPVDFGMIPIGAYAPRWFMEPVHMTPEEAVRVFHETRCRRAVGMHWGTFRLTDEPLGEPPLRLAATGVEGFFTGRIGESWRVGAGGG